MKSTLLEASLLEAENQKIKGDYQKAAQLYLLAADEEERNKPSLLSLAAHSFYKDGQHKTALKLLLDAHYIERNRGEGLKYLGRAAFVCLEMKEFGKAHGLATKGLETEVESQHRDYLRELQQEALEGLNKQKPPILN
jgi:tetratricopeptide (TPR) repeat protein